MANKTLLKVSLLVTNSTRKAELPELTKAAVVSTDLLQPLYVSHAGWVYIIYHMVAMHLKTFMDKTDLQLGFQHMRSVEDIKHAPLF